MPKPSGEWLSDDLKKLRSMEVDTIVSMLTPEEDQLLGLVDEEACCGQLGLDFVSVPVPDRSVPDLRSVQELVASILKRLRDGKGIAVHCRAGIGRSGLVVCCVLCALGIPPDQAIKTVTECRGVPVPDTSDQRAFIMAFSS